MSWDADTDAHPNPLRRLKCPEEGCGYICAIKDMPYHARTHIVRPDDDWLTLSEAAKAIGKPKETVRSWVRFNGLEVKVEQLGGRKIWISKKVLAAFLKANFLNDVEKVVEWAMTGKAPRRG